MRHLSHPYSSSIVAICALGVAGFVAVALGWTGVAGSVTVADQFPYLVSGGIGGLALIGFAVGMWAIQHRRLREAQQRAEFDDVVKAAAELLAVARREIGGSQ